MYTINEPATDQGVLQKLVDKHWTTLGLYLENRPIAKHTQAAFDELLPHLDESKPMMLDSGCGTGRSSLVLGEQYPDHLVVGVDRSLARLSRSGSRLVSEVTQNQLVRCAAYNVLLVQADLPDLWRLFLRNKIRVEEHYLLYPNPYPKARRLKSRFYAHPSFPLLLQLKTQRIVVRSNWEAYLTDFGRCIEYSKKYSAHVSDYEHLGPQQLHLESSADCMTNFEAKYVAAGEPIYALVLDKSR